MSFLLNPYSYGGVSATYTLAADPGALVLTGGAATLARSLRMVADPGALTLTGGAATLTYSNAPTSKRLLEDGTSFRLLEDGTSKRILE